MGKNLEKIFMGDSEAYKTKELDEDALYFITDTNTNVKTIYKGSTKLSGDFVIEETVPTSPEEGVIYYIANFAENKPFVGIYKNSNWVSFIADTNSTVEALTSRVAELEAKLANILRVIED